MRTRIETTATRRLLLASFVLPLLAGPGAAAPSLRIGVAHLPPATETPEARLFTDEGFEQEIGREIGRRLGVGVEFAALPPADLIAAVDAGSLDLALTRIGAGAEVPPTLDALGLGYGSALSVSMRTDTDIGAWEELAGRTVCIAEGNAAARAVAEREGARVRSERAPALSLMLVRTGACDAAVHDRALLATLFEDEAWRKFSSDLPPRAASELVAIVRPDAGIAAELAPVAAELASGEGWEARRARWARNVAFEVYLEQDAPDCH